MKEESCFGIIPIKKFDNGYKVFLVKLKSGKHWGFPKGHIEKKDNSQVDAAKRELYEETKLLVEKFFDQSFQEKYQIIKDNKIISNKTVTYFLALIKDEKFVLDKNEILDGNWFTFDEAIDQITYDNSKQIFKKVKAFFNNSFF